MRYLFFVFVLNVYACAATGTAHTRANADDADRQKALSVFGVNVTGTGYAGGGSILSIQCAPSGGDASVDAKAALRSARDAVIETYCDRAHAGNFVPMDLVLSVSGRVSCVKITVKVADIDCWPAE